MDKDVKAAIRGEAARVEEDSLYSFKGHFNAADRWETVHWLLGIATAVLAGAAGTTAIAKAPAWVSGLSGFGGMAMGAVATLVKPYERSRLHFTSGNRFKSLNSRARVLA